MKISDWWRALWSPSGQEKPGAEEPSEESSGPQLNHWVTFGADGNYGPGEGPDVVFTNRALGIRRVIVNRSGEIVRFPGVSERAARLTSGVRYGRTVHYRTDFELRPDGRIRMLWEIQPDGRYWADDDGFGMEDDVEIRLWTMIDERGRFTGPFEVYNIGSKRYDAESPEAKGSGAK